MGILFSPGCECCNPCCLDQQFNISSVTLQIFGVEGGINTNCTNCDDVNGTYVVNSSTLSLPFLLNNQCGFITNFQHPFKEICPLSAGEKGAFTFIDLGISPTAIVGSLEIGFSSNLFGKNFPNGIKCSDIPGTILPFTLGGTFCKIFPNGGVKILSLNP